ncbi:MAG: hypothetical protein ACREBD_06755 [Blastocatellia bacterium]
MIVDCGLRIADWRWRDNLAISDSRFHGQIEEKAIRNPQSTIRNHQ